MSPSYIGLISQIAVPGHCVQVTVRTGWEREDPEAPLPSTCGLYLTQYCPVCPSSIGTRRDNRNRYLTVTWELLSFFNLIQILYDSAY